VQRRALELWTGERAVETVRVRGPREEKSRRACGARRSKGEEVTGVWTAAALVWRVDSGQRGRDARPWKDMSVIEIRIDLARHYEARSKG
jgi:hypothetical protein